MRIPFTINPNVFKVYEPSKVALSLIPELRRTVKAEDRKWDETHPPKLSDLCLLVIVANFEKNRILDELPCWERNHLLETLPTNLPLDLVVAHIHDEIYWERMVKDRWKDEAHYCQDHGSSWKQMYLEKHVQEAVEAMTPEGFDIDKCEKLTSLTKKYVKKLDLRELQIVQPQVRTDDEYEFAAAADPLDHIDLRPIITKLENLTELHVQFGLRYVGAEYKKSLFQFSLADCRNLGQGVARMEHIRLLRVHNCTLDDPRVITLLSSMEGNKSLEELNFSHCFIGDNGATGIAKFLQDRPRLKRLNLCGNKIGREGMYAIAFMLTQEDSSPLEYLNVKFNIFGDDGFKPLASALVREHTSLKELNIACCNLRETSAILLAETLNRNWLLTDIDACNNHLGEEGGRALKRALEINQTIQFLDLRMTEIKDEDFAAINLGLHLNRVRARKGDAAVEEELKVMEKRAEEEQRKIKQQAEEAMLAEMAAKEEAEKLSAERKKNKPSLES